MAKKRRKDEEEGVDLSTAAEMWTEEELRQLIREEALKLIGLQQTPVPQTWIKPYPNPNTTGTQWPQQWIKNTNTYHDGHTMTANNSFSHAYQAVS